MLQSTACCESRKEEPELFSPASYFVFRMVMLQQELERMADQLPDVPGISPRQKRFTGAALAEAIAALENGRPRVQLRGAAE